MHHYPPLIMIVLLAACQPITPTQVPNTPSTIVSYRSGLTMLGFPSSDGYVFDFSTADLSLEEPTTVDLTISANALQAFHAPQGIMLLGPIPGCTLSLTPDDDIVEMVYDHMRENPIVVPATDYRTDIESVMIDQRCRPFVVQTWEGDYVLLVPVAHTIGGIDRYWFVWIYAEDGVREFVIADSG